MISKRNPKLSQNLLLYGPRILFAVILIGLVSGVSILWIIIEERMAPCLIVCYFIHFIQ